MDSANKSGQVPSMRNNKHINASTISNSIKVTIIKVNFKVKGKLSLKMDQFMMVVGTTE